MNEFAEALGIASGPAGLDSADPLPMEVPVRVRGLGGAGNLGADSAFEPFLEDTQTVLVSQRGAVLRLAAHAAPGQILSISSPRLRREMPARVIRYRAHANVKGYAEIEFTGVAEEAASPLGASSVSTAALPAPARALGSQAAQNSSAAAPALVIAPLADLLQPPPRTPSARPLRIPLAQLDPVLAPASESKPAPVRRAPVKPRPQAQTAPRPKKPAPSATDIEALLAARKAADAAAAIVPAAAPDFALRLFEANDGITFNELQRPRKRWLATAAAVALTLGAAGTWGVVQATNEPPIELPRVGAFALPQPPEIAARQVEAAVAPLQAAPVETETTVVVEELPKPLPALQISAPRASRTAPQGVVDAPDAAAMSAPSIEAGRSVALEALVSRNDTPAPPVAPKPAPPIGGKVTQPRLVAQAPVIYPAMARMTRLEGDVVIDARIDATGRVVEMRVISGPTLLYQAAKDSLAQWRYEPGTLNGKPVVTHLYVTIQFRR